MALISDISDFKAFQQAYQLALEIRPLAEKMPKTEQLGGIADQMRRASTGICANLAEGFGKKQSKPELCRYVRIARGSAQEMDLWLSFSKDFGYIEAEVVSDLRNRYENVRKMLNAFERSIS